MPFDRRRRPVDREFDGGFYPPPSVPRPVKDGLRAKSARGAIGETWWSKRFIEVLEDFHEGPRLARGRAYARRGQVIDMAIEAGDVTARVQGSRARPYNVSLGVTVLGETDWARVEAAMAGQAVFLARLLAGEMPHEIEDAFAETGLSLFPSTTADLDTDCSCPDWENPCKHIAAVYYLLAEAFDRDPFLIFAWRGRPRERLLADLRALRGGGTGPPASRTSDEPDLTLGSPAEWLLTAVGLDGADISGEIAEEDASGFWNAGDLASVRIEPRAVAMPEAILRDLGPSGLSVDGRPLEDVLAPVYRAIAAAAVRIAGGDASDGGTQDLPSPGRAVEAPGGESPGGESPGGESRDPNPPAPPRPRSRPTSARSPRGPARARERGPSRAHLERLLEAATLDCYDESEERTGLYEMLAEHLEVPFTTTVLGVTVTVSAVELTTADEIVAVCRRGRELLRVGLLELPMPAPGPEGAEWVDAYRLWARPR